MIIPVIFFFLEEDSVLKAHIFRAIVNHVKKKLKIKIYIFCDFFFVCLFFVFS